MACGLSIRGEADKDGISSTVVFVPLQSWQPGTSPVGALLAHRAHRAPEQQQGLAERERRLHVLSLLGMAGQVRKPVQDVPTATRHVMCFTALTALQTCSCRTGRPGNQPAQRDLMKCGFSEACLRPCQHILARCSSLLAPSVFLLSLCVSLCLFVSLCVSLHLFASLCVSLRLSVSLCVSLCLSVSLGVSPCLSVSLSVSLSLFHSLTHSRISRALWSAFQACGLFSSRKKLRKTQRGACCPSAEWKKRSASKNLFDLS